MLESTRICAIPPLIKLGKVWTSTRVEKLSTRRPEQLHTLTRLFCMWPCTMARILFSWADCECCQAQHGVQPARVPLELCRAKLATALVGKLGCAGKLAEGLSKVLEASAEETNDMILATGSNNCSTRAPCCNNFFLSLPLTERALPGHLAQQEERASMSNVRFTGHGHVQIGCEVTTQLHCLVAVCKTGSNIAFKPTEPLRCERGARNAPAGSCLRNNPDNSPQTPQDQPTPRSLGLHAPRATSMADAWRMHGIAWCILKLQPTSSETAVSFSPNKGIKRTFNAAA